MAARMEGWMDASMCVGAASIHSMLASQSGEHTHTQLTYSGCNMITNFLQLLLICTAYICVVLVHCHIKIHTLAAYSGVGANPSSSHWSVSLERVRYPDFVCVGV